MANSTNFLPDRNIIYLSVEEVLLIHRQCIERAGGASGVRDHGLLESAVFRPQSGYYPTPIVQAAALLESLLMNHPFVDGNKRTAFAATYIFLKNNGLLFLIPIPRAHFFLCNYSHQKFKTLVECIKVHTEMTLNEPDASPS